MVTKFDSRKHRYQLQSRQSADSAWQDVWDKPTTEKSAVAEFVRRTHNNLSETQYRVIDTKTDKLIVGRQGGNQ